jgi:hypothetical protein
MEIVSESEGRTKPEKKGGERRKISNEGLALTSVQGKNDARVKQILGLERAASGAAQKSEEARDDNRGKTNGSNFGLPCENNGNPRMSYVMQMALQGALDATTAVEKYAEGTVYAKEGFSRS